MQDDKQSKEAQSKINIGISSCLLGQQVRFDGGHKRSHFAVNDLSKYVNFVPECPEVGIGMGTPRETVRLEKEKYSDEIRMVAPKSSTDFTEQMNTYAENKVARLKNADLSGYILKSGSPTCGMERVRIYGPSGIATKTGRGLFAEVLMKQIPLLPVEEEGRLNDARLRDNFLSSVFAYRRLKDMFACDWTTKDLVEFHAGEKFTLLAHNSKLAKELGRLVANSAQLPAHQVEQEYSETFMEALKKMPRIGTHYNVLEKTLVHLRGLIGKEERLQIHSVLKDFYNALVPLQVPKTLVQHYVKIHRLNYLASQSYFNPFPPSLSVRPFA